MSTNNPIQSSTNLFRRLAWQSSVSITIRLADGEPGAGSSGDRYFIQAPRNTYLPLLIPEIRENLVELVLDDAQLEQTDEKDWWFEEEDDGEPGGFARQGACRWHWPIDLIDTTSYISRPRPLPESSSSGPSKPRQLKLLLHLSNPPNNALLMPNDIETCRTQWINQVKEGDFVRWRNTTKVTSLRRADVDAGWDGIVQDDFDLHTRMASRILPLPVPTPNTTPSVSSRPPSADPGGSSAKPESSYSTRALPIKLYLPDGAPVIQEVISPLRAGGKPTTLIDLLHQHLSLLFPPKSASKDPYPLAYPVIQGIASPPDVELAWLAACMCGADGWVRIGICIRAQ